MTSTDLLDLSRPFEITSRAPVRVDLAGGTLDIWPIYLFIPHASTINLGIDLFAQATLKQEARGSEIVLEALDQKTELKLPWSALKNEVHVPPALDLHWRLVKLFAQKKQQLPLQSRLILSTKAQSPAGAGLGGSSALTVAMIGALEVWLTGKTLLNPEHDGLRLIDIVSDIETQVIKVPAGLQDYFGAMYGGLQTIYWDIAQITRVSHDESMLKEIEKRLLLFYSGQSRNSGINNWVLFKKYIDRDSKTIDQFTQIAQATQKLDQALKQKNWDGITQAIADEWKTRHGLAPGISTPEIDQALAEAQKLGAKAFKICGAGGGGCFFVLAPDSHPQTLDALRTTITKQNSGIRHLEYKATPRGLNVKADYA